MVSKTKDTVEISRSGGFSINVENTKSCSTCIYDCIQVVNGEYILCSAPNECEDLSEYVRISKKNKRVVFQTTDII